MGRPPCCDKIGIKKGPWTPEEDIILVSYIQEHGPGNWRSVPTNTGLLRCSKSCRLRWTNYLRPGIKRGNFTPHEEGMIIHLQALLGNKWAAIASYLPQRTDNDIKNYWNTHLKKKLKKFQSGLDPHNNTPSDQSVITAHHQFPSNRSTSSLSDTRITLDITGHCGSSDHPHHLTLKNSSSSSNNSSSTYASSTENISRLLEGWMRSSPKTNSNNTNIGVAIASHDHDESHREVLQNKSISVENGTTHSGNGDGLMKTEEQPREGGDLVSVHEEFESILSFENMNNNLSSWERSSTCSESTPNVKGSVAVEDHDEIKVHHVLIGKNYSNKQRSEQSSGTPPLSFLEKWLLDETSSGATAGQVDEMMELSAMF